MIEMIKTTNSLQNNLLNKTIKSVLANKNDERTLWKKN